MTKLLPHYTECSLNQRMPFLQGQNIAFPMGLRLKDPLGGRFSGHHGGNIRNPMLDRPFAQIAVIVSRRLAGRSIDDQLNLPIDDPVFNIGQPFKNFINTINRTTCLLYQSCLTGSSNDY